MTAPWGVVLDENILVGVLDDVVEVLSDEGGETLNGGLLGDWLGLEVSAKLASLEVGDERLDVVDGEVLSISFPDVLHHLLLG